MSGEFDIIEKKANRKVINARYYRKHRKEILEKCIIRYEQKQEEKGLIVKKQKGKFTKKQIAELKDFLRSL